MIIHITDILETAARAIIAAYTLYYANSIEIAQTGEIMSGYLAIIGIITMTWAFIPVINKMTKINEKVKSRS